VVERCEERLPSERVVYDCESGEYEDVIFHGGETEHDPRQGTCRKFIRCKYS
jgi:hypothetical protein